MLAEMFQPERVDVSSISRMGAFSLSFQSQHKLDLRVEESCYVPKKRKKISNVNFN